MARLDNKIVLITGAGSGIGRAMAVRFIAEGAHIIAVDLNGSEKSLADEFPGNVTAFDCDVSCPEQIESLFSFVADTFPRLDILCNNAGVGIAGKRVHEIELADWDTIMSVNVRGFFMVLKHSLAIMIEQGGGAVVNTASLGGYLATAGSAAYITSKGAQVMLTKNAALDYAKDNIRVNAVCPGLVDTPFVKGLEPDLREFLNSQIPQGRACKPEEVASLALFLASDEASHITGQCYFIDGGRSAG